MKKGAGTRKFIIGFLVAVILFLIAAGGYLYVQDTKLEDITVEGNSHYTDSELLKLIFPDVDDRQTLKVWWKEMKGEHHDIPFVSRYEITLTGLRSAEIMVYEKNIVACLEYMDSIMFFDKDGIVVESASSNTEGVPLITGIMFSQIVMHEQIKTENKRIFTTVLTLTQLLAKHQLRVDKIGRSTRLNSSHKRLSRMPSSA